MISISHSPNSDWKQQLKSLSYFVLPWKWLFWRKGPSVSRLEEKFSEMHHYPAISFSTGREALYAILDSLNLAAEDEIIIQAYTCIVVPNSILWAGAKPVYADIDETLNLDPASAEELINNKTKAIIIQHAFGMPANLSRIQELCKKNKIVLIEDCALSLGAKYDDQLVGTFGDAAIFSFGRDKIISSVSGGMAIVKNDELLKKVRALASASKQRSLRWVFQNLMHPLLMPWMSRLIGKLKIGQILIFISQNSGLLNKVYTKKERCSEKPSKTTYHLPSAQAALALQQFNDLNILSTHRSKIVKQWSGFCDDNGIKYQQVTPNSLSANLRFPIFTKHPEKLIAEAKIAGFIIGDWYNNIVVPKPRNWSKINYVPGSCPKAEKYSASSVNLPTHRKLKQKHIEKLMLILKKHYGK